jgi:hypothetical protein
MPIDILGTLQCPVASHTTQWHLPPNPPREFMKTQAAACPGAWMAPAQEGPENLRF